jgi:hypothetical protein
MLIDVVVYVYGLMWIDYIDSYVYMCASIYTYAMT